nr:leucine zipper domain-containing protein [Pseudomonas fluorescens]
MTWRKLKPMDLKVMFIAAYLADKQTFSKLCRDYEISLKTGYKWVERYETEGASRLKGRSRCRHNQSYVVPVAVRQAIVELRSIGQTTPGPKKI